MAFVLMFIAFTANVAYSIYIDYRKDQVYINQRKEWAKEREFYTQERQQLLDRIQAPSYDVMKHHEVKIIKAKNNEKEPEKLEVM